MNTGEIEIYEAIREEQSGPTVIRHLCFFCKTCLADWEVQKGRGVCWRCIRMYFPTPVIPEESPGPRKAILFQLKNGKYVILLD